MEAVPIHKNLLINEALDKRYDKIIILEEGQRGKQRPLDIVNTISSTGITITRIKKLAPTIKNGRLEIRPSTIKGAGNGVFAVDNFKKGQLVTYYQGPILPTEEFEKLRLEDVRYVTHARQFVPGRFIQVGNQNPQGKWITDPGEELKESGVGSYINDARGSDRLNVMFKFIDTMTNQEAVMRLLTATGIPLTKDFINHAKVLPVKIDNAQRLVAIVATRNIESGEELFINYGELHFELIKTGISCSWCGTDDAKQEETKNPELKFCDTSCLENYYL